MKVFFIFSNAGFLGHDLVRIMQKHGNVKHIDIASFSVGWFGKIKLYTSMLLLLLECTITRRYIHIHYPINRLYKLLPFFDRISKGIILTYWGSDLHVQKNSELIHKHFTLISKHVEKITFPNESVLKHFASTYGLGERLFITRFGLAPLEAINNFDFMKVTEPRIRELIDLRSSGKKIVVCGTNLSKNQQFERFVPLLSQLSRSMKENCVFVFCFNYGEMGIYNKIVDLIGHDINTIIINNKLTGHDLAALRICTDCLVQLQKHDMLSGAMQESLYAGAIVVTGTWLNYDILKDRGAKFVSLENIESEFIPKLESALLCKNNVFAEANKKAIHEVSSWSKCEVNWVALYEH